MRDAASTLLERLEKLKHFNKCYDDGQESFSTDIATVIRTICKDSRTTQSLLTQTGLKAKIIFCMYSDAKVDERDLGTSAPLCIMSASIKGAVFMPKLDEVKEFKGNKYFVKFNQWWDQVVIKDSFKNEFTRKDLVETVCDKEGGAHFDSKLDQKSENLFHKNSINWTFLSSDQSARPFDNKVHLASIRHISYELVNALEDLKNNS
jgi:hypothetical protein